MASNKSWEYTVTYQDPEDAEKTPAQRREESVSVEATTAARALNKAKTAIVEDWEGLAAKDIVILDVVRSKKWEAI